MKRVLTLACTFLFAAGMAVAQDQSSISSSTQKPTVDSNNLRGCLTAGGDQFKITTDVGAKVVNLSVDKHAASPYVAHEVELQGTMTSDNNFRVDRILDLADHCGHSGQATTFESGAKAATDAQPQATSSVADNAAASQNSASSAAPSTATSTDTTQSAANQSATAPVASSTAPATSSSDMSASAGTPAAQPSASSTTTPDTTASSSTTASTTDTTSQSAVAANAQPATSTSGVASEQNAQTAQNSATAVPSTSSTDQSAQTSTTATTDQSASSSKTTTDQSAASVPADQNAKSSDASQLPQTGSPLPLLGLLGMGSLAAGFISRKRK